MYICHLIVLDEFRRYMYIYTIGLSRTGFKYLRMCVTRQNTYITEVGKYYWLKEASMKGPTFVIYMPTSGWVSDATLAFTYLQRKFQCTYLYSAKPLKAANSVWLLFF